MDLAFVNDGWLSRPFVAGVALDASGFVTGNSAYWQDGVQSAILVGRRSPAPSVAHVDFAALRHGVTRPARLHAGFQTFLYRSSLRLGEGIVGSGNESMYAGPFQPYLVHLPHHLRRGLPLVVYMHGASQTHTSPVNTSQYDRRTRIPPIPLPDAILQFDAVVAWPLGRGPLQNYWGVAEQDVLDVTDDILARLQLDRDRVMLAGLSLGGIGAFRLGELYPDRWSLVYADVGYDQAGLTSNLTNVPVRAQNAVADPLVNPNFALQTRRNLQAADTVDYMSAIQLRTTHQPTVKIAECVYRHAFTHPRRHAPPRVRYTIDPSMFLRNRSTGLRQSYSGAYWVSGMRAAGRGRAAVDLVTHALGKRLAPGPVVAPLRQNLTAGRDFCGPNVAAKGVDVWSEQARHVQTVRATRRALLTGSLSGLSSVTIDAERTGLRPFRHAILRLRSDHPVALSLRGLRPGAKVVAPSSTRRVARDGRVTVRIPSGTSVVRVAAS
jgi:pimeloyl-ACP methyl ester carboxylesterase